MQLQLFYACPPSWEKSSKNPLKTQFTLEWVSNEECLVKMRNNRDPNSRTDTSSVSRSSKAKEWLQKSSSHRVSLSQCSHLSRGAQPQVSPAHVQGTNLRLGRSWSLNSCRLELELTPSRRGTAWFYGTSRKTPADPDYLADIHTSLSDDQLMEHHTHQQRAALNNLQSGSSQQHGGLARHSCYKTPL